MGEYAVRAASPALFPKPLDKRAGAYDPQDLALRADADPGIELPGQPQYMYPLQIFFLKSIF